MNILCLLPCTQLTEVHFCADKLYYMYEERRVLTLCAGQAARFQWKVDQSSEFRSFLLDRSPFKQTHPACIDITLTHDQCTDARYTATDCHLSLSPSPSLSVCLSLAAGRSRRYTH